MKFDSSSIDSGNSRRNPITIVSIRFFSISNLAHKRRRRRRKNSGPKKVTNKKKKKKRRYSFQHIQVLQSGFASTDDSTKHGNAHISSPLFLYLFGELLGQERKMQAHEDDVEVKRVSVKGFAVTEN
ncbi:uncharacterized protein LOC143876163 [Tasmannia lanceolata]|uniref:uncharacterized protein LOC143876163 n=1 Tax=Tasmannia lanceolata TaxID=3420 RepID=UPI00406371DB